jgi:hypothetical protein
LAAVSHLWSATARPENWQAVKKLGELSLVVVKKGSSPIDDEAAACTRLEFNLKAVLRTEASSGGRFNRLRHEFDPAYFAAPRQLSDEDRQKLLTWRREYDLIWIHTIPTANELLVERWPNSVLDIDDIPSRLYSTRAQAGKHFVRSVLDKRLCWIWRRREARLLSRFDVLVVCSEEDRNYLGNKNRVHVAPNGFDLPEIVPIDERSIPARLGFIGLFHYKPNEEGVKWFIEEVGRQLSAKSPKQRCVRSARGVRPLPGWNTESRVGVGSLIRDRRSPRGLPWLYPYEGVVEHA